MSTPQSLFSRSTRSPSADIDAAAESDPEETTKAQDDVLGLEDAAIDIERMLLDYFNKHPYLSTTPVTATGRLTFRVTADDAPDCAIVVEAGAKEISQGDEQKLLVTRTELVDTDADDAPEGEDSSSGRKRAHVDLTADDNEEESSKRRRTSASIPSNSLTKGITAAPTSTSDDRRASLEEQPAPLTLHDLQIQIAKQVRWIEDCRRIADGAHGQREEKWRTTSATFHDGARKDREVHEKWMVGEMTRQNNMLVTVINDLKGIYPLLHGMKWETPPLPQPLPQQPLPAPPPPKPVQRGVPIARLPNTYNTPVVEKRGPGRPRKYPDVPNGTAGVLRPPAKSTPPARPPQPATLAGPTSGVPSSTGTGSAPGPPKAPPLRASGWRVMVGPRTGPPPGTAASTPSTGTGAAASAAGGDKA